MRLLPRAPQSLAGRFAILLVLALMTANAVAVVLLSADRARVERAINEARDLDHVIDVIATVKTTPADARRARSRSLTNPFVQVDVSSRAAVRWTPPRYRNVAARISAGLDVPRDDVAVGGRPSRGWQRVGHRGDGHRGAHAPPGPHTRPRRGRSLWISVALGGGQYTNVVLGPLGPIPQAPFAAPLFLMVALSLLSVLGVGLVFVRRLTRPIRHLAEAAGRAGRGDHTAMVAETGPRELRDMAAAFNDMQARIARFDQDRMRLIAAVGHDLRTPITSLRIRAEMLDEEVRAPMVRTLDDMHVMADALLAFAKGEAAEGSEMIALSDLVARVCEEVGAPFEAHAQPTVLGRPVALSRMVRNLLANAERYAGGAAVSVERLDGRAVIAVADNGPGIPADRLEDMMEPFTRLDGSRSTETGGAGLGLSIARSVARAHGGELTLANREGGGLLARVELPLVPEER